MDFEEQLHKDLQQYLQTMKEVDERFPTCPDVDGKWDCMDEYIIQYVLLLHGEDYSKTEKLVGGCESRVYHALMHQRLEPGTRDAFEAFVTCLHQLYLFGSAIQLKRLGYHLTAI